MRSWGYLPAGVPRIVSELNEVSPLFDTVKGGKNYVFQENYFL